MLADPIINATDVVVTTPPAASFVELRYDGSITPLDLNYAAVPAGLSTFVNTIGRPPIGEMRDAGDVVLVRTPYAEGCMRIIGGFAGGPTFRLWLAIMHENPRAWLAVRRDALARS